MYRLKFSKEDVSKRFNQLNLKLLSEYVNSRRKVEIKCHCGNIFYCSPTSILSKNTKSCGCLKSKLITNNIITKENFSNYLNKYGLKLIEDFIEVETYKKRLKFLCRCGKEFYSTPKNIIHGGKSCGCNISEVRWKGYGEISNRFFDKIKRGAIKRNIIFDVRIEYLWDLFLKQKRKCKLSGVGIVFSKRFRDLAIYQTASLDRIDSLKGYVEGNVQWVHKNINIMKMDLNQNDFINWCNLVSLNNK